MSRQNLAKLLIFLRLVGLVIVCFVSYSWTSKFLLFPIRALKCGVLVLQLPSPPTDDEGDFIFVHHEDVRLSQKADEVYAQLVKLLKDQHEVTILYFLEI